MDNVQEQIGNMTRKVETQRKSSKGNARKKTQPNIEMKDALCGLMCKFNTDKEIKETSLQKHVT